MSTYLVLANVNEEEFQNPQELVSIWGDIREDIDRLGGELRDSYALLGEYDFKLTFEAESEDVAMQISMAIERHGLDTRTHHAIPVAELGTIIEDV